MGLVQDDMEWVINNDVEFLFLIRDDWLKQQNCKKMHKKAIIHIEVETGMNRTGFENEINTVIAFFKKKKNTFS
jgi:alanine racemase